MDVVKVNGIEYERVSSLAKRFKYTSDYVGQLCRQNKVDAKRVGRSWYVNPDSLKEHKENRYHKNDSEVDEKTNNNNPKAKKSRINVEPVLTSKTTKIIKDKTKGFSKKTDWKPLKYEYDEMELLPNLDIKTDTKKDSDTKTDSGFPDENENSSDQETKFPVIINKKLEQSNTTDNSPNDNKTENPDKAKTMLKKTAKNKASLDEPESNLIKTPSQNKKNSTTNDLSVSSISTSKATQKELYSNSLSLVPKTAREADKQNKRHNGLNALLGFIIITLLIILFLTIFADFKILLSGTFYQWQLQLPSFFTF